MMFFSKVLIIFFLFWGSVNVKQFAFFAYQRKPLDSLRVGDKIYNYNACPFSLRVANYYINENLSENETFASSDMKDEEENKKTMKLFAVYDLTGQIIQNAGSLIDLNNLSTGIYFLQYETGDNKYEMKKLFVK